jgi:hypothetical protein
VTARRSTPQRDIDDRAFPVRIRIEISPKGFGLRLTDAVIWLGNNLPKFAWAHHSPPRCPGVAFYFRAPADASRFLEAFPDFVLADQVCGPGYSAPGFVPRGMPPILP